MMPTVLCFCRKGIPAAPPTRLFVERVVTVGKACNPAAQRFENVLEIPSGKPVNTDEAEPVALRCNGAGAGKGSRFTPLIEIANSMSWH